MKKEVEGRMQIENLQKRSFLKNRIPDYSFRAPLTMLLQIYQKQKNAILQPL